MLVGGEGREDGIIKEEGKESWKDAHAVVGKRLEERGRCPQAWG